MMWDVVKVVGVFCMIVFRVLCKDSLVLEKIWQYIFKVVRDMNYVFDQMVGSLIIGKFGFVVMLFFLFNNLYFVQIVQVLIDELEEIGLQIFFVYIGYLVGWEEEFLEVLFRCWLEVIVLFYDGYMEWMVELVCEVNVLVIEIWEMLNSLIQYMVGFLNFDVVCVMIEQFIQWGYS